MADELVERAQRGDRDAYEALARAPARDLFAPVLPVTHAVMRRMPDLVEAHPALAARDLVHVATCLQEGITDIVSPDRGFDSVPAVRRIAPDERFAG